MGVIELLLWLVEGGVCGALLYFIVHNSFKWGNFPRGSKFRLFESLVIGIAAGAPLLVGDAAPPVPEMCAATCIAGGVRAMAQGRTLPALMHVLYGGVLAAGVARALPLVAFVPFTHLFWLLARLNLPGLGLALMALCCASMYSARQGALLVWDLPQPAAAAAGTFTFFIPVWLIQAFVSTKIDSINIEMLEGMV